MSRGGDTIFAMSSGMGRAGIAVIRLSGRQAGTALTALAGRLPQPRFATVRALRQPGSGALIDRAMVIWMPGPGSFTGEDCAELHIHGGRAVIDATMAALGRIDGLRLAEAGEFTRRAFLNGKIDLTAAEATADLIDADTDAQRRQALRQASGALAALYEGWRERLVKAMALLEATIDFSDEADVSGDLEREVCAELEALSAEMGRHLADGRRGEILRDGFHVALAGPPNAGKSSLLNILAQRDVAIVSPHAGTTRDVIETRLDLDGLPIVLSDAAGIRSALDSVEGEGIKRALARAEAADLILWVMDGTATATLPPGEMCVGQNRVLLVRNKSDLAPTDWATPPVCPDGPEIDRVRAARVGGAPSCRLTSGAQDPVPPGELIAVSAKTGDGIDRLVAAIAARARSQLANASDLAPTRIRHRQHVETARAHVHAMLSSPMDEIELRAEDLRLASIALGRITGRVDVEDLLDRIFSTFCIGK